MALPDDPLSALELRLGNIVLGASGQPIRIDHLTVRFEQKILERKISLINPLINRKNEFYGLPLDIAWLVRLGFQKKADCWALGRDEIILCPEAEGVFRVENVLAREIRHVHQLQNLMFVIRGFEQDIFL